jgi:hypothetical protein
MRKTTNVLAVIALMLAVLMGLTLTQVRGVSAQSDAPVGVVVAYTPGVGITIVDQKGNQIEFALAATVKIEPPDADKSLKVGSYVTIIAPASISKGKQVAVGIVVHPEKDLELSATAAEKELLASATPLVKDTPAPSEVPTMATPKVGESPTAVESATADPMATLTVTATSETTVKAKVAGAEVKSNPFIEWLKSLFRKVLSQQ